MAVLTTMHCPICKATDGFSASEYVMPYRTGTVRAPALECLACGAIVLDEVAAHTDKELECVRQAQVVRLAVIRQTDHRHVSPQPRRSDRIAAPKLLESVHDTAEPGGEEPRPCFFAQ